MSSLISNHHFNCVNFTAALLLDLFSSNGAGTVMVIILVMSSVELGFLPCAGDAVFPQSKKIAVDRIFYGIAGPQPHLDRSDELLGKPRMRTFGRKLRIEQEITL